MSRAARLLGLMQCLHRHRFPVPGAQLAAETGVSLRTLYRDIATLQAEGAVIEGTPGQGYLLRPGFMLPPLMFDAEEIDALVLGVRWVAQQQDPRLAEAARRALNRIAAALPEARRQALDETPLEAGPVAAEAWLPPLRRALRAQNKVCLRYRDAAGQESERIVWPVAIGFFEQSRVLAAWCETRAAFRHFRLDRIVHLSVLDAAIPRGRQILLHAWRQTEGVRTERA